MVKPEASCSWDLWEVTGLRRQCSVGHSTLVFGVLLQVWEPAQFTLVPQASYLIALMEESRMFLIFSFLPPFPFPLFF
jgi:hypothetical protein